MDRSYSALISNESSKNAKLTKITKSAIPRKTISHVKNNCSESMIGNDQINKLTQQEYYQNGRVY